MMMKAKSTTTRMTPMLMIRLNKIMLKLPSIKRIKKLGARATTRAQISCDKLLSTTKRTSSYNMRRDKKPNKRSSNAKKSRLRDAEKKRQQRDSKHMSRQTKQEKREPEEKQRKRQQLRRENKKPENAKRRKRLQRRLDELKHRRKPPRLPASKLSKPFQTLSLIILT